MKELIEQREQLLTVQAERALDVEETERLALIENRISELLLAPRVAEVANVTAMVDRARVIALAHAELATRYGL